MDTLEPMETSSSAPEGSVVAIWIVGDAVPSDVPVANLGLPIEHIQNSRVAGSRNFENVAFVVGDFESEDFKYLQAMIKAKEDKMAPGHASCILGPTALRVMATMDPERRLIQSSSRPLYCNAMEGLGVCFNSHRRKNKEELTRFFFLIQSMGGSIYKDVSTSRVTHLVADNCRGERYRYASTFSIPIMAGSWIEAAWANRNHAKFKADDEKFVQEHKVKPFHGAIVNFLGFHDEERIHMIEELLRNGGKSCDDFKDPRCTHVVVDDTTISSLPADVPKDVPVVKSEWFWASIQMDACAEEKYHVFSDHLGSILSPLGPAVTTTPVQNRSLFSPGTPGSSSSAQASRKRKRRKEVLNQLAQNDPLPSAHSANKRRSSVSDLALLSMSGSLLDTPDRTLDPSGGKSDSNLLKATSDLGQSPVPNIVVTSPQTNNKASTPKPAEPKPLTPRQHVFHELVQTEINYVGILRTILEVFKRPLEDPNIVGGELLNQTEMRIIFGNIPPIYEVHSAMLAEFQAALQNWRDDFSIGEVFLRHAKDLLKAYPPYVNFLEDSKRRLMECDKQKPRFHAFLKVCQSKPECGRQSLSDLMVRPIQRLPSVILLMNDLIKHTKREKDHKDLVALESALNKLKEIATNINEDKRKTEGQVCLFEIFSDIENCPPHLVSSHRSFCNKIDVIELGGSDELCGKGYELSLFLFNDVLEISKKKSSGSKGLGLKSPSTMSLRSVGLGPSGGSGMNDTLSSKEGSVIGGGPRSLKHVNLMNLTAIKRVVDVVEVDMVGANVFALVTRTNQELKERMFVFQIVNEDVDKNSFLRGLCRNIANTMYRPDPDTYLKQMRAEDLGLDASDLNVSNFGSRAYRSLHRKVNRAFSFNKTPTGSRLKRAVSSMISPIAQRDKHQATTATATTTSSNTPSGDLQNLRLASCTNLLKNSQSVCEESPKSSRRSGIRSLQHFQSTAMMSPPSMPPLSSSMGTPERGVASMAVSSSALSPSPAKYGSENVMPDVNNGFTLPKTPTNKCSRRPSFKFKGSTFQIGGKK